MGYRSEVVLAIAPEAASAFMALCAKSPEVLEFCQSADRFESNRDKAGDWFMHWSHIKWYDSFPEIGALNGFIEALSGDDLSDYGEPERPKNENGLDNDWGEYFKFIRIGEEGSDVTEQGWGFHDIFISRCINF